MHYFFYSRKKIRLLQWQNGKLCHVFVVSNHVEQHQNVCSHTEGFNISFFLHCLKYQGVALSYMLIKHRKISMVYNYGKFLILGLVENAGLAVLVVRRPSEQFPLSIPRCTLQPHLEWQDCLLMNIGRFPWCILSHEIPTLLPSISTVLYWIQTAIGKLRFVEVLKF